MTPTELAISVAEALTVRARERYEVDGFVDPAVSAIGKHAIVAVPPPGPAIETVPILAYYLAWAGRSTHIAFIAEAWSKEYAEDDPAGDELRAGDLGRQADTDPAVSTAIMVDVYDVLRPGIGAVIESVPRLDPDGHPYWDTYHLAPSSGDFAEAIRYMLAEPPPEQPPPGVTHMGDFGHELCEHGLAHAVWVEVPA